MTPRLRLPSFAGWMMVLVVLISAVPSAGQARTRVTGSAFDPATYSVVVSPKKLRIADASGSINRNTPLDHLFDGVPIPAEIEPAPTMAVIGLATRLPYLALPGQANGYTFFLRAHGPRAPPTV